MSKPIEWQKQFLERKLAVFAEMLKLSEDNAEEYKLLISALEDKLTNLK